MSISLTKRRNAFTLGRNQKAYNEKRPINALVIDRIKGGLTVDIHGAHHPAGIGS